MNAPVRFVPAGGRTAATAPIFQGAGTHPRSPRTRTTKASWSAQVSTELATSAPAACPAPHETRRRIGAVGRRADLLLLEADPLADVANVGRRAGVMVNGRWLPAEELERRLAEIAEAYAGDRPEGEAAAR